MVVGRKSTLLDSMSMSRLIFKLSCFLQMLENHNL